ncbi:MAG: phosphoglycerate kinase [Spirochaetia bacterium]|nr:phosphoglycerate kinase [Spirochaetota bacterium]MCX8095878.1 phosphoglycerate kinase [Spirochaetota bacterium]MDW8112595.1 phosphoglycerate kinase [Spirochaetia bacterium]
MNKKTVKDIDLSGKKVFVREDFNVPLDANGNITDYTRVDAALPTIKYLLEKQCAIVLASHLGRPKGRDPKSSLIAVQKALSERLGISVKFASDCINDDAKNEIKNLKPGEVLLLENVRFYKEEEANDENFARNWAELVDVYVCDAFGSVHRAHASVEALPRLMKQMGKPAVAGFLVEKELEYLGKSLNEPKRPFVAILGGSKVSTKIDVINSLLNKVDKLLIGGGMMFTFYKAMGIEIGKSLLEQDYISVAFDILQKSKEKNISIVLPEDVVVTDSIDNPTKIKTVGRNEIPSDMIGVDIGPATIKLFGDELKNAKTIFWNGPLGVFEKDEFAKGTVEIAKLLANLKDAIKVIGGGDSAAAVAKAGVESKMTHISTGGGASLEFVEGKPLPGVVVLDDK